MFWRCFTKINLLLVVVGGLFWFSPAFAAIQNVHSETSWNSGASTFAGVVFASPTYSGADPYSTHTRVNNITVWLKNTAANNCHVNMHIVDTSLTDTKSNNTVVLPINTYTQATFSWTGGGAYEDQLRRFYVNSGNGSDATSTNPCSLSSNYNFTWYAGDQTYPYGWGGNSAGTVTTTYDPWFQVNGGRSEISFYSTPTSTCTFNNWKLNPPIFDATDITSCQQSGTCSVGVAWNANFYSDTIYQFNTQDPPIASSSNFDFTGFPYYLPNTFTFTSGTVYNARAYLCSKASTYECFMSVGGNSNLLAWSDNYDFIINGLDTCTSTYMSQGEAPPPTGVTSSAYASLTAQAKAQCDRYNDGSVLGGIVAGLCNTLVYLFVPGNSTLQNFVNLKSQVANKPPFGYISAYSAAFTSLENSPSSTAVNSTSTWSWASSLTIISNWSITKFIRDVLAWFLWISFFLWVWHRLRKLSLRI